MEAAFRKNKGEIVNKKELKSLLLALKVTKAHPADTRWKWVKNQLKSLASK